MSTSPSDWWTRPKPYVGTRHDLTIAEFSEEVQRILRENQDPDEAVFLLSWIGNYWLFTPDQEVKTKALLDAAYSLSIPFVAPKYSSYLVEMIGYKSNLLDIDRCQKLEFMIFQGILEDKVKYEKHLTFVLMVGDVNQRIVNLVRFCFAGSSSWELYEALSKWA